MKTVAFVPIKLNNERLPNKNTMSFTNGDPLISYILDTLSKVKNIDEIYVYCSDESVKKYLPENVKFLKRPKYLDLSETSFNEVLINFSKDVKADIYVLTHATAPFIKSTSIEVAVEKVLSGTHDSAFGVHKLTEFLWDDSKPVNYDLYNIPRTQDLPDYFTETCGLYVYKDYLIKNEKRRIGDTPYLVELSKIESIDINDGDDFIIADAVFNNLKKDLEDE